MSQIPTPVSTITLETFRQQFVTWRESRKQKSRISDELWEAAVALSSQYPVHQISKILRINHTALRHRIAVRNLSENTETQTCFFELPPSQSSPPVSECSVEMENRRGERMRMHLTGEISLDLSALSQNFWIGRS